ncbi:hypothetical protein BU16DRAFT_293467 [Lophium mytilinum]|uniref:Uncharacterized protein n=1 Tax=Lophium mytilinum TaxID=390894 RepID=A0A6A6R4P4_9PEZI|nr:hypothetical protein BU16DRAFT_293467 [Lophium mytilinum]
MRLLGESGLISKRRYPCIYTKMVLILLPHFQRLQELCRHRSWNGLLIFHAFWCCSVYHYTVRALFTFLFAMGFSVGSCMSFAIPFNVLDSRCAWLSTSERRAQFVLYNMPGCGVR